MTDDEAYACLLRMVSGVYPVGDNAWKFTSQIFRDLCNWEATKNVELFLWVGEVTEEGRAWMREYEEKMK